jgi:hypothetical protein
MKAAPLHDMVNQQRPEMLVAVRLLLQQFPRIDSQSLQKPCFAVKLTIEPDSVAVGSGEEGRLLFVCSRSPPLVQRLEVVDEGAVLPVLVLVAVHIPASVDPVVDIHIAEELGNWVVDQAADMDGNEPFLRYEVVDHMLHIRGCFLRHLHVCINAGLKEQRLGHSRMLLAQKHIPEKI